MRVLVTADTVGGVWTYTRELVTGLIHRGHSVVLVTFGRMPVSAQLAWLEGLPRVELYPTEFPLEWMQDSEAEIAESMAYLERVILETHPDVLHSSQFCYGAIPCAIPKILVAHSDVIGWWKAVHGSSPPESDWIRWYRDTVLNGLQQADLVVAPSRWMLDSLKENFGYSRLGKVIYNGRDPALFQPSHIKQNRVLSVGRLWDQAKQVTLLLGRRQAVPVQIIGQTKHPDRIFSSADADVLRVAGVEIREAQSEPALSKLFATASIYAATSRYEPFGLAPVEAALSQCALIANDIPTFRELWGDSALYFLRSDPDSLADAVAKLSADANLREWYAERAYRRARACFDSQRMIEKYQDLYQEMTSTVAAA